MTVTSVPSAKEDHDQAITTHKNFEPIQYTKNKYENSHCDMKSEIETDEHESENLSDEEDEHARKRLRTEGLFVPSNGFVTGAHKVQAPTLEHVEEKSTGASCIANGFLDQETQATDISHGPRVPGLYLTTLLPQRLQESLTIVELPPELDASHMNAVYTMISIPVPGSMNFKAKYSLLLQHFTKIKVIPEQKTKPLIFVLTSTTNCTVKIITLAEKLKRDLASSAIKCFQYCAVQAQKVLMDRVNSVKRNQKWGIENRDSTTDNVTGTASGSAGQDSNDNEEEEAFQTMAVPREGSPKVTASGDRKLRRLPIMTIFLGFASVPELRQLYQLASLFASLCQFLISNISHSEQTN